MNRQLFQFIVGHMISISLSIKFGITFWVLLAILVLWVAFILGMGIKRKYEQGKLNGVETLFGRIYLFLFLILDVFVNYTAMVYWFRQIPSLKRKTVTARLINYLETQEGTWRFRHALFFCKYMIEPWDFGHCKLLKLGLLEGKK